MVAFTYDLWVTLVSNVMFCAGIAWLAIPGIEDRKAIAPAFLAFVGTCISLVD